MKIETFDQIKDFYSNTTKSCKGNEILQKQLVQIETYFDHFESTSLTELLDVIKIMKEDRKKYQTLLSNLKSNFASKSDYSFTQFFPTEENFPSKYTVFLLKSIEKYWFLFNQTCLLMNQASKSSNVNLPSIQNTSSLSSLNVKNNGYNS